MKYFRIGIITIFILIVPILYAQVRVDLDDRIKYPEVFISKHLHDTILVANQGFHFSNFASVRFELDKNGSVHNIAFSTYADSLVMPHITNVLMSTNKKWIITRNERRIKGRVSILLPILFIFKSKHGEPVIKNQDILSLHPKMSTEEEIFRIIHFSNNRDENFEVFKRKGMKFEGIVLNPIEVIVPMDSSENQY